VAVNADQSEDWNGASGREFIEQRERHQRMLGLLKARLLPAAQIQDGENVLDIGCGCGDVTILAARATGSGRALGADFSKRGGSPLLPASLTSGSRSPTLRCTRSGPVSSTCC
jgi:2-polyprenyl-3-methyl-5-hydroxy-6-metoxy-1,4-benzoquinol methylase